MPRDRALDRPLLAPLGARIPITPERAQIAFFRRAPTLRHLIYIDTIAGSYFRPHGQGDGHVPIHDDLTLAGLGGRKLDDADPDHFREANDAAFIDDVRHRLGARIPALAEAPYARGHAGIYDVTPDQRPILDEIPGISGLYVAAGFSGTGFKTAPAVGAAMAALILSGPIRSRPGGDAEPFALNEVKGLRAAMDQDLRAAIAPFSYTRFMTGKLISGEHEYVVGSDFGHTL